MWGPGELLVSRDSGRSDWSKCWFGVIRRLIIRRRQARVSVNVPEGALAAFESGPLDPTFLLEVSRSELPIPFLYLTKSDSINYLCPANSKDSISPRTMYIYYCGL